MPADELCSNDFQDIGEALVIQHAVDVFLALFAELLISSELSDLLVFILEFLQSQFHAANAGFIRFLKN